MLPFLISQIFSPIYFILFIHGIFQCFNDHDIEDEEEENEEEEVEEEEEELEEEENRAPSAS